jgi:hypothetical protein
VDTAVSVGVTVVVTEVVSLVALVATTGPGLSGGGLD